VYAKGVDSHLPPNPIHIAGYGVEVSHPLFYPKFDPDNKSDVQVSLVRAAVSYPIVARSDPFVLARSSTWLAADRSSEIAVHSSYEPLPANGALAIARRSADNPQH
jgi:hypothetical protein